MTITDADYWMVRRDTDRCVLLSHDRGVIVATRREEEPADGQRWELLVRLDGEEIHDDVHTVADKDEHWAEIEAFGDRFQGD